MMELKQDRKTNKKNRGHWSKVLVFLACIVVFCTTYALILPAITMEVGTTEETTAAAGAAAIAEVSDTSGAMNSTGSTAAETSKAETTAAEEETKAETAAETTAATEAVTTVSTEAAKSESTVGDTGETTAETTAEAAAETLAETDATADGSAAPETSDSADTEPVSSNEAAGTDITGTAAENETVMESEDAAADETEPESEWETATETETETETETGTETESESETGAHVYIFEDDNILVEVTLPADSSVPEDAVLTVTAITDEDDADTYASLTEQAESAVEGGIEEVYFYDISFFTVATADQAEEYIPVSDEATVTLTFKEKTLTQENSSVAVLHYEEEAAEPVVLEEVELTGNGESEPETLTFQTEGFSVYAVVTVAEDETTASQVTVSDVDSLNGYSYLIVSSTGNYAMMAETGTDSGSGFGMTKSSFSSAQISSYSEWLFESDGNGGYYISSNGSYLYMYTSGYLGLTTSQSDATAFTVTAQSDGKINISASINGTTYYINQFYGDGGAVFRGYDTSGDGGNNLILYSVTKQQLEEDEVLVTDLDGKTYAIANLHDSSRTYALLSSTASISGRLNAGEVTVINDSDSGTTYVVGDDITAWTFIKTDTAGVYYIYDAENDLYLNMSSSSGLYTSSTPMGITVTAGTGNYEGLVRLSANGTALDWYGSNQTAYGDVFGAYNGSGDNNYQTLCEVVSVSGALLFYNLNLAGGVSLDTTTGTTLDSGWYPYSNSDGTWVAGATPSVESTIQNVTGNTDTLYSVSGVGDDGYFTYISGTRSDIAVQLMEDGKSPGKVFTFDGWEATVTENGTEVTYTFAEDAVIDYVDQDGNIYITDTSGVQRVLPSGTVLTGIWTEISDIVMFFVNYSGTVLDVEGDVTGRDTSLFTGIIAIGHVYFGTTKVGEDAYFATEADEEIRSAFTFSVDMDDGTTVQIVIDYVTEYDGGTTSYYNDAEGINDEMLEEYLLAYIRNDTSITIQVSTSENATSSTKPTIDNENATSENYSVRWYVLKEQYDGYHIDGVMVARTVETTLTKNFYGLEEAQVNDILTEYQIDQALGTSQTHYGTIKTSDDVQYEYEGQQGSELSYRWLLYLISNEKYTLTEENYELSSYDVTTLLTQTYENSNSEEITESASSATTTALTSGYVVGGYSEEITYDNFYTPSGTGGLAIKKISANGSSLSDAVFTLYSDEEMKTEVTSETSRSNGSAFFTNLSAGTYYLKETTAPSGYKAEDTTWKVVVSTGDPVTVTVYESDGSGGYSSTGTSYYSYSSSSGSGTIQYLQVSNSVDNDTLEITKTFSGLKYAEMQEIYNASTSSNDYETNPDSQYTIAPYYIELELDSGETVKLYLQDATSSTTSSYTYSYTWLLTRSSTVVTDAGITSLSQDWTVTEYNYRYAKYTDTVAAAKVNGEDSGDVEVDVSKGTASFAADLTTTASTTNDTITIQNTYTNTFTLSLSKVDSVTGTALEGAEFKIYGPYSEATTTEKITYTDDSGQEQTLYYISTITSDADGIATASLTLSSDTNVFLYVLDESSAPAGYAASTEPTVITVTVESTGYSAGVYSVSLPNTKVTTLTAEKVWETNVSSASYPEVTLTLYQAASDGTVKEYASITLNGTADEDGETAAWTALWSNLPVYDGTSEEDPSNPGTYLYGKYTYYVTETSVNGYETTYSLDYDSGTGTYTVAETVTMTSSGGTVTLTASAAGGGADTFETVEATMGNDGTLSTVTVINSAAYVLPKTGGPGTWPYRLAGAVLLAAAALLYKFLKLRTDDA